MTARRPTRLTVLTSALLVMLPALALLQYRWVGQVSDAERERMLRNMRHAAAQFRETFDGEIARAFVGLQVDGALVRDEDWNRYAERHAAWAATTPYPALVANVYVIDSEGPRIRLRRWSAATRRFETATWEAPLARLRTHFEEAMRAFASGRPPGPPARMAFHDEESLLVAPLLNVRVGLPAVPVPHTSMVTVFGFTVLELNLPFIRDQLLPNLAARHFTHTDGADSHVAVIDAKSPGRVVYRSSPEAPTDPVHADATEPIFSAHRDPLMFLAHGDRLIRETRRSVIVSVMKGPNDDSRLRTRVFESEVAGRWILLVQHQRGSLEAAVAGVRQRNLLISFGILLLMGVSVGLLTLSSRRAQQLARQQMEFVAGVSHELRTPVAVIRSAAENLSHGVVGDPDRVRRYGDAIQGEARRLGEMVERVLQFAGIESGRPIARMPLALAPLMDDAVASVAAPEATTVTIERHVAADLLVLGDAAALRSAIANLVMNAVKYGGADRWIGIRAEASHAGPVREVRITVEDHGPGIKAADLAHIFDPFYRGADVMARQIQGSGLGLALVRRIAEAHGGRVSVVSREGAGSAFTIHLPLLRLKTEPAGQVTLGSISPIAE